MGSMRFRRSVKIAPGVRLNVSKKGVGVSAGVKGARVSTHSTGRTTTTVGVPGTGLHWREDKRTTSKSRPTSRSALRAAQPDPGTSTPVRWPSAQAAMAQLNWEEKSSAARALLVVAVRSSDLATLRALADVDEVRDAAAAACALLSVELGALDTAVDCADIIDLTTLLDDPLAARLLQGEFPVDVVPGRRTHLPARAAVPLVMVQALCRTGRYEDVFIATDGLPLEDEPTALLTVERARAFVGSQRFDAAKEVLAPIVRRTSIAPLARAHAFEVRTVAHLGLGRRAQAVKDVERLMAADSSWPSLPTLTELVG